MFSIDQVTGIYITSFRSEDLTGFFLSITHLGDMLPALVATAAFCAYLVFTNRPRFVPELLFAILGTVASVWIFKNVFSLPRPESMALVIEDSYSFPSGHAAVSMALFGFMIYMVSRTKRHPIERRAIIVGLAVLIILIGVSRIYLGVHYLSDVIAGYVLGALWLLAAICLEKRRHL